MNKFYYKVTKCEIMVLHLRNVGSLSVYQVGFGDSSGWFVDPLKKLAGALGALEIESAWVIDRV